MPLYNFYLPKNLPFETLSYLYDNQNDGTNTVIPLEIGQICHIPLKNEQELGVVQGISGLLPEQIKNLKSVGAVSPFKLSPECMEFLVKTSFLTFNPVSNLLPATLKPYSLFNVEKFDYKKLKSPLVSDKRESLDSSSTTASLEYYIEVEWSLRIMTIIRSIISAYITHTKDINILIISPEKNIQNREVKKIGKLLEGSKGELVNLEIEIFDLTTTSEKKLRDKIYPSFLDLDISSVSEDTPTLLAFDTTPSLLEKKNRKINVFFGNKNALFLDLKAIKHLIVLDEANPSYISEQKVYFDAREVAFWASQIYKIPLAFVSTLPSVRFLDLAKEQLSNLKKKQPNINIKLLQRHKRQDDFENILLELDTEGEIIIEDIEDRE